MSSGNYAENIKKIICIGRNYAKHARELGNEVPKEPFWFLKPSSSIVLPPNPIELRKDVGSVHHEIELGVVIGKGGRNIPESEAMSHVLGYTLGLDLTARDLQIRAKERGLPWSIAKGMDCFCPLSSRMIPRGEVPDPQELHLWCRVNGEERQSGFTSDMIFGVRQQVANLSKYMRLEEGDLILTGTPEGVGPIASGDVVEGGLMNLSNKLLLEIKFHVY